ncbi:Zinc finger protein 570 [Eumeta japonica]|uniref:Zinc finger protein 570 n=1 Tax=Eumeta variegata TaxID=151549 RepID=A0A4C1ZBD8_EUMVA|nr:Zinc finger protein 570 [Eumeta japonica]
MEATRWNLRECSVLLRRCDFAGRRSAVRAEGGVLAEPREPVTLAPPRDFKDCDKMNLMVKTEFEDEDSVTGQELYVGHAHLWENSMTDVGLSIKEENDSVMKTENDTGEVTVKEELDIGPILLQPKSVLRPLPPLILASSNVVFSKVKRCNISFLHQTRLHPQTSPAAPRPSTGSADVAGPAPPCLEGVPPTEVEDNHCVKHSEILADSGSVLHSAGEEDVYYGVLSEQNSDRSDNEYTSMGRLKEGQDVYCVGPTAESDLSSLKIHIRTHTDEKPYRCKLCVYSATLLGQLKEHMRTHVSEKPYKCEECEYSAFQLSKLKRHIRSHTGVKPYKCEVCQYCACQLGHLKRHMRIHTGEKPYRCEACEYSSSRLEHLKKHMRTHTGEKPYRCEVCKYSSSRLEYLKKHMRIHTGEKPYSCGLCEYSASQSRHLKEHIRTHTGEKPYRCEHCEYCASQLGHLKRHMSIHTSEKPYRSYKHLKAKSKDRDCIRLVRASREQSADTDKTPYDIMKKRWERKRMSGSLHLLHYATTFPAGATEATQVDDVTASKSTLDCIDNYQLTPIIKDTFSSS